MFFAKFIEESKSERSVFSAKPHARIIYNNKTDVLNNILTEKIANILEKLITKANSQEDIDKIAIVFNILLKNKDVREYLDIFFDDKLISEELKNLSKISQELSNLIQEIKANDIDKITLKNIIENIHLIISESKEELTSDIIGKILDAINSKKNDFNGKETYEITEIIKNSILSKDNLDKHETISKMEFKIDKSKSQ